MFEARGYCQQPGYCCSAVPLLLLQLCLRIASVVSIGARQRLQQNGRMKVFKSPSKCRSGAEGKGKSAVYAQASARPQNISKLFAASNASPALQRTTERDLQMCNSTGSYGNLPLAMQSFVVEAPVQCREHTGGQQEWDVLGVGQAMVSCHALSLTQLLCSWLARCIAAIAGACGSDSSCCGC